ncbi:MAG: hypothetical protein HQL46_02580 [Gammaproteobacteria bacterium]|nr:hypothetical protein [Gammaproteobacteria bacterium]
MEVAEKLLQEQKDKETQKAYQIMNNAVDNYLDGLSEQQLSELQNEFANSILGNVFKR